VKAAGAHGPPIQSRRGTRVRSHPRPFRGPGEGEVRLQVRRGPQNDPDRPFLIGRGVLAAGGSLLRAINGSELAERRRLASYLLPLPSSPHAFHTLIRHPQSLAASSRFWRERERPSWQDEFLGAGARVRVGGAGAGAGAGHRRPAAERRQLHGAHAALVPRARRAGAAGQGVRRARAPALHLGRDLPPVPPLRVRPRAPIRRPRKHGEFTHLPSIFSSFSGGESFVDKRVPIFPPSI
jgi:hypothetical protein